MLKCSLTADANGLRSLGKRIAELQTSLTLLDGSSVTPFPETQDRYKRKPFRHPALEGLAGVNAESKAQVLSAARLGELAERYGLDTVLRWKPKRVCSGPSSWSTVRTERS